MNANIPPIFEDGFLYLITKRKQAYLMNILQTNAL